MFTDTATVTLRAGRGGNGVIAWRREKYIPKGGPYGGNGGPGASIIVEADKNVSSLDQFRHLRHIFADNGGQGETNCRQGKSGKPLTVKVPCGTLVRDAKSQTILYDLMEHGEQALVCVGGKGGKGNAFYRTPTHQAPARCSPGLPGEEKTVALELKMIADVGLVGFPNAGKSTLLQTLTKSPTKIGAYPFTTLHPHLGTLEFEDYTRIILADIPGILEGAHTGRGLGLEFLRHIERNKALLFVVDASGEPEKDLEILRNELNTYNPELLKKPHLILLNKIDLAETLPCIKGAVPISALTGEGIDTLKDFLLSCRG
jgi:GTP-binding protein